MHFNAIYKEATQRFKSTHCDAISHLLSLAFVIRAHYLLLSLRFKLLERSTIAMGNTLYMCKRSATSAPGHDPDASELSSSSSSDSEGIVFDQDDHSKREKREQKSSAEIQAEKPPATESEGQAHGFENPFMGVKMRSIDSDSDAPLSPISEESSDAGFDSDTEKLGLPRDPEEEETDGSQARGKQSPSLSKNDASRN